MTVEELKIRRLVNQHLTAPDDYRTVARDLCGLQAQFLSNALHAIAIRSNNFQPDSPAGLVKSWTVRGTIHVFSEDDLPLFLHRGHARSRRPCDTLDADERITQARKRYFADLIVEQIASGVDTRDKLKAVCADHGMTEEESGSVFNPWGGTIRALCDNGTICHVLQEKKAFRLCPPFEPMEEHAARLEMARRYFTHFGPATVRDAAYFFGATQAEVRGWLSQLPVVSAVCDGAEYFGIETGADYGAALPACLFLAGFDQLMLGYQKTENPFLPQAHLRGIFNLAGIVMPAVLLHGRVVGKWKQKGKKLSVTLFEPVGARDRKRLEGCAMQLWPSLRNVVLES